MTNQLASLARRDYFYLDAFWWVDLGMYIIMCFISNGAAKQPIYSDSNGKLASVYNIALKVC